MRNFVGAFDCIDKPKLALRQPFELQKQEFTRVFSVLVANILNKVKNKQTKRNNLIHNYFMKNNPVYSGVASKGSYLHKNTGFLTPNSDICRLL